MNEPIPKHLQRWETVRQKGAPHYILLAGVLAYGVTMFVLMTFFVNRRPDQPLTPVRIAISAVIWMLAGALFGWIMWKLNERRYQRFLAKRMAEK